MSRLYGVPHRALQDRFQTRALADRIGTAAAATVIEAEPRAFIESRDLFFLSSIDPDGRPTMSYKGGAPGFVGVLDDTTLALPSYGGNGMYLSMGNAPSNPEIDLLFIEFEAPTPPARAGPCQCKRRRSMDRRLAGCGSTGVGHGRRAVAKLPALYPSLPARRRLALCTRCRRRGAAARPLPGWKRLDGCRTCSRTPISAVPKTKA